MIKELISPQEISRRVVEVAAQIDRLYMGNPIVLVMILKGSFILVADLIRALKTPVQIEMVRASSYGHRGKERGELTLSGMELPSLKGQHVLLVDDIFDSGQTLTSVAEQLRHHAPQTLRTLVLLEKRIPREVRLVPDWVLFHIEDQFVVGYGLDYKEAHRGYPGIGVWT